jgi:hypothetical protein
VVGRRDEPAILSQGFALGRVSEEVQRSPSPFPPGPSRLPSAVEDREAPSTNPEERTSLELGLVRARKGTTDPSDQLQRVQVLGVERHR